MPQPRSLLAPALPLLRTFEAVCRHGGFARAAEELNVSASAISQQMRLLEGRLGIDLFERRARGLTPTLAGQRLSRDVAAALADLDAALARIDDRDASGPIVVSTVGSFALEWLLPRIGDFQRLHPAVSPLIRSEARAVDLRAQEADLAIRFGCGDYPGLWSELLLQDAVFPVCAPGLAPAGTANLAELVARIPLIHDEGVTAPDDSLTWRRWLIERKIRVDAPGLRLGDSILALRAALAGEGLMLARRSIAAAYLADGRLVRPVSDARRTEGAYYVVAPPGGPRGAAAAFCEWVMEQAAAFA
jgi:LysR family glycine cleavage system transcriptional activator